VPPLHSFSIEEGGPGGGGTTAGGDVREQPMLARVKSGALLGVDAYIVEVEVDLAPGLPAFTIVTQWERNSFFLSFRW
jgi:hypothetical protein